MGENFRRKARFVADGHKTDPPATLTYASVVSRDPVRLFFLLAALNDLKVAACDIEGAYLTDDCREKIYIVAGPEFGPKRMPCSLSERDFTASSHPVRHFEPS